MLALWVLSLSENASIVGPCLKMLALSVLSLAENASILALSLSENASIVGIVYV